MSTVYIYKTSVDEKGYSIGTTVELARVPVAGDKLFITQKEGDDEVAYVYKVIDVHLMDKGSACVVVEPISDNTDYIKGLKSRGVL